jgi:leucyl aminopeptidase (aminopeptidase T)
MTSRDDRSLGARKLIEANARVRAGEQIVIVTDHQSLDLATPVAFAAAAAKGEVVTCIMAPRARDGQEPPDAIARAMREADVIFSPVSTSITHTVAMKEALQAGARAILMTAWTSDTFTRPALLETDFEAQKEVCHRLGKAFTENDHIRLTSPSGTDLTFSIAERTANILTNVPESGELAPVPDIEVNVVPVEGTAEGIYISDASLPYLGIGVLEEPIKCIVEEGFVTQIEGGEQALFFEKTLRSYGDKNCFNVAELGVGLNPNAQLTGMMLEDEGVLGTIHVELGTSHTLGGKVVAPTHYDLLMWHPIIRADGTVIQRDREILVQ